MELAIKIVIGLLCVPLTGVGAVAMFAPAKIIPTLGLEPDGSHGLSEIRGVIGGFLLSTAVLLVLGLTKKTPCGSLPQQYWWGWPSLAEL